MKKILSILLAFLIALGAFSFVGCDEVVDISKDATDPDETEKPTEKTTEKPTEKPTERPSEVPTEKPTEKPTDTNISDGNIVIGMTAPLSGDALLYGRAVEHGAKSAIAEINEAGGINGVTFSLNVKDDKNDASLVGALYEELINEGMKISLGSVTSGCCLSFAESAQNDGVFTLTPTATDRDLFGLDRTYGMDFAYMDEMDVLIEYLKSIYDPSDSNSLGLIYSNSDPDSKTCKEYLLSNCGGMFSSANIIDAEVAWDAYDGKAAKQLAKCKNVVVLYEIDNVTVDSLAYDVDYIKRSQGARTENFVSVYTFYDFSWGIIWDPQKINAKILMPFDIMAENGDFADFREKYSDFHYSDAMVALGYDAVYAIYEALLVAVENGEKISANLSAEEFGEILDGVFASGFVFDALTGGEDGRGSVTWYPDGRVNKGLFPVTVSSSRK